MLNLSKDFTLKEWISGVLLLVPSKLPLLSRAQKGSQLESDEISFYTTKQIPRTGVVKGQVEIGATSIVVNEELAKRLTEGYILMYDDELIKVKSVNKDTKTLTVERGYANTPRVLIKNDAVIKILSKAEAEGKITEDFHKLEKVRSTNVAQTFTKSIYVSKDAAALQKKNYVDMLNEERIGKVDEEGIEINTTLYYGRKKISDDGRRTMGGWKEAIINDGGVVFGSDKNLTEEQFENILVAIATKQGKPTTIFLNAVTKAKVFKKFKNAVTATPESQTNMKAGGILTGYLSDALGYELKFEIDECVQNGDIFVGIGEPIIHTMRDVEENVDVFFQNCKEPSNSSVINETLKTTIVSEFQNAYQDAYISNAC